MGPCKDCKHWHCVCEWDWQRQVREYLENERQYADILTEHRELAAEHDQAFQAFMRKVKE